MLWSPFNPCARRATRTCRRSLRRESLQPLRTQGDHFNLGMRNLVCPSTPAHAGRPNSKQSAPDQISFNPCARRATTIYEVSYAAHRLQPLRTQGDLQESGHPNPAAPSTPAHAGRPQPPGVKSLTLSFNPYACRAIEFERDLAVDAYLQPLRTQGDLDLPTAKALPSPSTPTRAG
jgi:hypothetical protein